MCHSNVTYLALAREPHYSHICVIHMCPIYTLPMCPRPRHAGPKCVSERALHRYAYDILYCKRAPQKSPTKELYKNKLVIVYFAQDRNNRALQRSPTKNTICMVSFLKEPVKKLYKRALQKYDWYGLFYKQAPRKQRSLLPICIWWSIHGFQKSPAKELYKRDSQKKRLAWSLLQKGPRKTALLRRPHVFDRAYMCLAWS